MDEKKKKQDDKLKKAQQLREAQDKEKFEKARKLLQVCGFYAIKGVYRQFINSFLKTENCRKKSNVLEKRHNKNNRRNKQEWLNRSAKTKNVRRSESKCD